MGRQHHFERVRALVSRQSGVPEAEITPETRLVEDLGIDGDDGTELLKAFADEFRVDMAGMAPLNYFGDEGFPLPVPSLVPLAAALSPRFRDRVSRASRGRRVLTVRSLVAAARAGRWVVPELRPDAGRDLPAWPRCTAAAVALAVPVLLIADALRDPSPALPLIALAILAALAFRVRADLARLRRLDAAAAAEERLLSAAD